MEAQREVLFMQQRELEEQQREQRRRQREVLQALLTADDTQVKETNDTLRVLPAVTKAGLLLV